MAIGVPSVSPLHKTLVCKGEQITKIFKLVPGESVPPGQLIFEYYLFIFAKCV